MSLSPAGENISLYVARQARTSLAAEALQNFYSQAQHHLSIEQIQLGLIEVMNPHHRATSSSVEDRANETTEPALLTRRSDLRGRTPRQMEYLQQIQTHDITFSIGPAGTGKTYLAVASAVDALERDIVARIVLVRPAVEAGERLGFLPGDMVQKVDPYLASSI